MKTKHFILALFGILLLVKVSSAQDEKYVTAMKDAIEKFSGINSGKETAQNIAALFERIALAEQNKWLPYYYAAHATILQSFLENDNNQRDKILDHAQSLLDIAIKMPVDSSEWQVLQGFLYIARLQIYPMERGAEYSTKANESFQKAIDLNPSNPRGYYMKGVTLLNTPEFFGGGKDVAKPLLTKAVEKFEIVNQSVPFYPDWGKQDCRRQLEICLQ